MAALENLLLYMRADSRPGWTQHAAEFPFGVPRRKIDDAALHFASGYAPEHVRHDLALSSQNELPPNGSDKSQECWPASCGWPHSRGCCTTTRALAGAGVLDELSHLINRA